MTRFSPPERHTRDSRPAVLVPQPSAPAAEHDRPERERPPFRRIALIASVPGLSRPS